MQRLIQASQGSSGWSVLLAASEFEKARIDLAALKYIFVSFAFFRGCRQVHEGYPFSALIKPKIELESGSGRAYNERPAFVRESAA